MGCSSTTDPHCIVLPVEAMLVPKMPAGSDHNTFYFGISEWSKQWEAKNKALRKRIEVDTTDVDPAHKLSTLRTCISNTVAAYGAAAQALNALDPNAPKVIHHALGHGHADAVAGESVADLGAQIGLFSTHEFRLATRTFTNYLKIKGPPADFNAGLVDLATNAPVSPKERARQLLIFDGVFSIRQAIKGKVSRVRMVTCRIGDDLAFLTSFAYVLGRCQSGDAPSCDIVLEAYNLKVAAVKRPAEPSYRLGLIADPNKPDDLIDDSTTELPSTHLVRVDPAMIRPTPTSDPLYDPSAPASNDLAMSLGDCASQAGLIPPSVATP